MLSNRLLLVALAGLGFGALSACDGIGKGISPTSSVLLPSGGAEGDASFVSYRCLVTPIAFVVDFSNGARGDFSSRATWTSSRPDLIKVSNGDVPVPDKDGQFYLPGVVVPVLPTSTPVTITGRYLDFVNTIQVTAEDPTNLAITPAVANLAVSSVLDLSISGDLGGKSTSFDGLVTWSFQTAAESVATISSTSGLLTGKAASAEGQLVAKAEIAGCPLSFPTAPVNVSPLANLVVTGEFTDPSRLVVGTTQRVTATGTLDNGATQDLTSQVSFTATDTTSPVPSPASISFVLSNVVRANSASTAVTKVEAKFPIASPTKTSNALEITPITATLNSLAINPESAELMPGKTVSFKAVGNYTDAASVAFMQDITRHVTWTSSDTTYFLVQTSGSGINPIAGLLLAASSAPVGTATTITATSSAETGSRTDTAPVTVIADSP